MTHKLHRFRFGPEFAPFGFGVAYLLGQGVQLFFEADQFIGIFGGRHFVSDGLLPFVALGDLSFDGFQFLADNLFGAGA